MSSESATPASPPTREEPRVPPEVLRLARRRLVAGERLEMGALAAELGVNRVTLYRWVGSRERLLVEVLWSMADEALGSLRSEVPPTADRAVAVIVGFIECVLANPGMQHLLAVDTDLVMRLLTHRAAGFQPRLLQAVEDLLREETAAGRLDVPMDPHELAYVVVRVIESYTYLDVLLGEQPEARRAEAVLRLLLGGRRT
ncbi:QsdR family transcriptional regulator [Geodermatophilus maliterrae]|uniref:QsdR family transcriptional regulator n=1 Tax=Geodermatophilus maliterrae TaxID=3162531 RepID=A0ABV3XJJ0_9ACTN